MCAVVCLSFSFLAMALSVCFRFMSLTELSLPIDILSYVFLCCDVMLLFQKKGEGLDPLKRLIPLQMFAPVLSQESDVQ